MKMKKLKALIIVIIGIAALPGHAQDRSAKSFVHNESYELRIYYNQLDINRHEPQIKSQIKVGALFFAKSESKSPEASGAAEDTDSLNVLYVVSGVLHMSGDGKFTLEHTFMAWLSPVSNSTYSSDGTQLELDKPQYVFFSDGIMHGYTVVVSKVQKI